jgi:hypothetical protein
MVGASFEQGSRRKSFQERYFSPTLQYVIVCCTELGLVLCRLPDLSHNSASMVLSLGTLTGFVECVKVCIVSLIPMRQSIDHHMKKIDSFLLPCPTLCELFVIIRRWPTKESGEIEDLVSVMSTS